MRLLMALAFALLSFSTPGAISHVLARDSQSAANSDSAAVQKTVEQFLEAFANLDWERFRSFFAVEATVFFPPSAQSSHRANGRLEIETVFRSVFDHARKQKSSAPYLNIQPKEMKIQMLGDVAIVTFQLDDPDSFGRRTIVFQRQVKEWFIAHLHASAIMAKP